MKKLERYNKCCCLLISNNYISSVISISQCFETPGGLGKLWEALLQWIRWHHHHHLKSVAEGDQTTSQEIKCYHA